MVPKIMLEGGHAWVHERPIEARGRRRAAAAASLRGGAGYTKRIRQCNVCLARQPCKFQCMPGSPPPRAAAQHVPSHVHTMHGDARSLRPLMDNDTTSCHIQDSSVSDGGIYESSQVARMRAESTPRP